MGFSTIPLFLALAMGALSPISAKLGTSAPLDLGYRQMYNLEFSDAHRTFQDYDKAHPGDPIGPASDAAAYLFEEFNRLGILQTDLFIEDDKFQSRDKLEPNPAARENFNTDINQSQKLADDILRQSPNDRDALFSSVLNLGLEADYLAMIEKRDLPSLAYSKRAGLMAEKLLAIDPTCYDAYLAVGVENYILGLKPAPVRWVLRLYGAETDKDVGVQKLQLAATKGHYLLPFARLLLAVAALRDKDPKQAKALLRNLSQEFPNNQLYRNELARLQ